MRVSDRSHEWSLDPAFDEHPVVGISWIGAALAAYLVGGRLPYFAEWRELASGGPGRRFPWGDDEPTPLLANVAQFVGGTTPVGKYPGHRGLYDLVGNADEWCMDWASGNVLVDDEDSAARLGLQEKVVVGGSWSTPLPVLGSERWRGKWRRIGTRNIGCRIVWESPKPAEHVNHDYLDHL